MVYLKRNGKTFTDIPQHKTASFLSQTLVLNTIKKHVSLILWNTVIRRKGKAQKDWHSASNAIMHTLLRLVCSLQTELIAKISDVGCFLEASGIWMKLRKDHRVLDIGALGVDQLLRVCVVWITIIGGCILKQVIQCWFLLLFSSVLAKSTLITF